MTNSMRCDTTVVSARVDTETKRRFDRLAHETNRPTGFYLKEALESAISELEYVYGVAARVERIRAGHEELISDEQLVKELGLESGEVDFSLLDDVQ